MPITPGYQFASDNCAGICPEAWEALRQASEGYAPGYGDDSWTARASDLLRELFETDCQVFFCLTGTAANSMAIGHLCQSYHSVICHRYAHLETDECGGPEFFTNGTKILLAGGAHGKMDVEQVRDLVERRQDIHYPKPRVLSLTQSTEMGTTYKAAEIAALADFAHRRDLHLHMDGARFANAAAALETAPKDLTWKAGVDVLCFGGTKNGMPVGEAVIFFDRNLAEEFDYRCKQAGQLASKMRFLAAPWVGMLQSGAWLERARWANRCAMKLSGELTALPNVRILHPVEANAAFVEDARSLIQQRTSK
ncbi:MAG: Low specificity L-threonine aldolase [bacterium]|nr:Low specificity L-threonine aldolase [bacterium]